MYYEYEYRGHIYTFDSYDTDIVFYPEYDYATYGYGYQVDWYEEGPYERMSFKFNWEIRDGVNIEIKKGLSLKDKVRGPQVVADNKDDEE